MDFEGAKIADLGSGEGGPDEGAAILPELAICCVDSMVKKRHGQTFSERLEPKVFGIHTQHCLHVFGFHGANHPQIQKPDFVRFPVGCILTLDLGQVDAIFVFSSIFDQQVETEKRVFVWVFSGVLTAVAALIP